jgi:hypothetical protein
MTHWLDFFIDGRKLFIALISTIILLILYFVYQIEIAPFNIFLILFSSYFGELPLISFLIFYYFVVSYVYSVLFVSFHDLITIMIARSENVNL